MCGSLSGVKGVCQVCRVCGYVSVRCEGCGLSVRNEGCVAQCQVGRMCGYSCVKGTWILEGCLQDWMVLN